MKVKSQSNKVNKAWLNDHVNDPWVKRAAAEGYRARAAYKLLQIDRVLHLVRPGQMVVDLGSTPGAWSQYLRRRMGASGSVIAIDLLPMAPIDGVTFIQGDFGDDASAAQLADAMDGRKADLVLSDMAPNLSGIAATDGARIAHLVELAVAFADDHLTADGALVAKTFHGAGYEALARLFAARFRSVKRIKPDASRAKSAETFLVGLGLRICGEGASPEN